MKAVMEPKESIDLNFGQYLLVLKRHWVKVIGILVITVSLASVATRSQKPSYQTEGKLRFKVDRTSALTGLGTEGGDLTPLVSAANPLSTEMEVISSNPLLQKTIDALHLKNEKGEPLKVEDIKPRLTVKIVGGADVLKISYQSREPEQAAAVVNKLMLLYIENNILVDRAEAVAAREFIAQQLPQNEATVRQADEALRRFKEQNKVLSLSDEATSAVKVIADLDTKIATVQAELERVKAQSIKLSKEIGLNSQDAMIVSTLSQSPGVQGILQERHKVEKELVNQESRFQEQSPTIVSLKAKKASLTALLQEQIEELFDMTQVPEKLLQIQLANTKQTRIEEFLELEAQRFSLARQLSSLSSSRAAYEQRVNVLPQLERNQRELERRLEAAQATYVTLLKKLQEVQVAKNQGAGNARIIQPALVPETPMPGGKGKILVLGTVLGLFLSTTTVLILETRDRSLKTLKEVRKLFDYPLLGVIPFFGKRASKIPVRDAPHSLVREMYRMTQTNLRFASSDKKLKSIVVTSSVPKEGKSTVSANLAAAMAQRGRRVLLIDADLHHPSQHDIWELTNAVGLSELLVGKAKFCAATCAVMDNLDVLTTGVMPSNQLASFDFQEMASLIQVCSDKYDFVIIDAPPLILAADTLTLSQMTDGMLLVARPRVVDYDSANAAKEMLERSGHEVLGLLVNGVIQKDESISYLSHAKEYFTDGEYTSCEKAKLQPKKSIY